MKKIRLKNIVWKEGDHYVSWNINTNVSSFGSTKKEALEALEEALTLYFEDMPASKITNVERLAVVPMEFKYA